LKLKTKLNNSKKAHTFSKDENQLAKVKITALGNDGLMKKNQKVLKSENLKLVNLKIGQKLLGDQLKTGQTKIERIELLLAKAGKGLEGLQDQIKMLSRGDRDRLIVHKKLYKGFEAIKARVDKAAGVGSLKKKFGGPALDAAKTAWRNWKVVSRSKRDSERYKELQKLFQTKSLDAKMNCHQAESKKFAREAKINKLRNQIVLGQEIMSETYLLKELMNNFFQSKTLTPEIKAAMRKYLVQKWQNLKLKIGQAIGSNKFKKQFWAKTVHRYLKIVSSYKKKLASSEKSLTK
jgi:hypothetical protein